jgi:GTP-binding protein
MSLFQRARFYATIADMRDLPPPRGAEVAFVGRSNAGKSSAINAMARHRRLAFVSKAPGRTRHINFFALGEERFLVDLPGYGYASAPLEIRRQWQSLLADYLASRASLRGLMLLMDIRRPLMPLDRQLLGWFAPSAKPVHILLTKCDKISRQQAHTVQRAVERELGEIPVACTVQLFSSLTRQGLEQAEDALLHLFGAPK